MRSNGEIQLLVRAEKIEEMPKITIQQSDYLYQWKADEKILLTSENFSLRNFIKKLGCFICSYILFIVSIIEMLWHG